MVSLAAREQVVQCQYEQLEARKALTEAHRQVHEAEQRLLVANKKLFDAELRVSNDELMEALGLSEGKDQSDASSDRQATAVATRTTERHSRLAATDHGAETEDGRATGESTKGER